jgi:septum formation protein
MRKCKRWLSVVTNLKLLETYNQIDGEFMIDIPKVILASASPRRAEILRSVGWAFESLPVGIEEILTANEDGAQYVQRLAREKAGAAAARVPNAIVIGADTTVTIGEQILEKPADHADAERMLRLLRGRWHRVLTGVAVVNGSASEPRVALETTSVKFAEMSDNEIKGYVSTGEPMDKAGAYAIQGFGALFIEEIRGDYFNVVGLPVRLLYRLIKELGR